MTRSHAFALLASLMLIGTGVGLAQEGAQPEPKSEPAGEPKRYSGILPRYWGQIGINDDQKQEIYKRQSKYKSQIRELEAKIAELKKQERKELYSVLTEAQKTRLKEIILSKIEGLELPDDDN